MTAKPPQQWKQMLANLRERGPRGVHTFELRAEGIGNPSQRVTELERMGHVIDSVRERFGPNQRMGARYTLRVDAGRVDAQAPVEGEQDAPSRLFAGVEVGRGQRSAIYDSDMGEAA